MSNVCCKEFSGWLKSFTRLERALAVLEGLLLVVLLVLLILLVLHLVACSSPEYRLDNITSTTTSQYKENTDTTEGGFSKTLIHGTYSPMNETETKNSSSVSLKPIHKWLLITRAKCSWTPSAKTTAATHYYEGGATEDSSSNEKKSSQFNATWVTSQPDALVSGSTALTRGSNVKVNDLDKDLKAIQVTHAIETEVIDSIASQDTGDEEFFQLQLSNGEEAEKESGYVAALVKLKPPKDVIFGCILTIISNYWTLTAASCIEAIEEMDSLDSFVIMQDYGSSRQGPLQTLEDVQIHPLYEGNNNSFDLAALKSAGSLVRAPDAVVELASMLDLALTTIGERLSVLGYGAFRSMGGGRAARRARVHALGARQCAAGGAALRHLGAGRAAGAAREARGALCAGVLGPRARTPPCNYCAGAPLLRGAALLALMADNRQCGVACEPQLYVPLPPLRDWIAATIRQ